MNSVDKLFKLADRFARKMSLAQTPKTFAQPSEVQKALQDAGLWDKTNEVMPLLDQAGVDAVVSISIVIDSKLNVKFTVASTPPPAVAKLSALLKTKYGAAMSAAIAKAGLAVSDVEPVTVGWLTFK